MDEDCPQAGRAAGRRGAAAAGTTGLVLALDIVPLASADLSIPPGRLAGHLPASLGGG